LVVRIFPNAASCLRLVRALAAEIHEEWIQGTRYLNMDLLEEHQRNSCGGGLKQPDEVPGELD